MRKILAVSLGAALAVNGLAGCHSHYIDATVQNNGTEAISPIEVDYPSASFGKNALAAGSVFRYRFKVLGSGSTKVVWTDARSVEHTVVGPALQEGNEGALVVTVNGVDASVTYTAKATH